MPGIIPSPPTPVNTPRQEKYSSGTHSSPYATSASGATGTSRVINSHPPSVTTASSAGAVEITALDRDVADRTVAQLTEIAQQNAGDAT